MFGDKGRDGHPAQLDMSYNPPYIPQWMYEDFRGWLHNKSQPPIHFEVPTGVIIPLRDSQDHVNKMLEPLLNQTHTSTHIYLVGNVGDKTWPGINPEILTAAGINLDAPGEYMDPASFASPVDAIYVWRGSFITLIEIGVPQEWSGRDSNLKRNIGSVLAIADGALYLFYTDAKIIRETDWIEYALHEMSRKGVGSMAGEMVGTPESRKTFWGRFTDDALIRRNPSFGEGYILSLKNFDSSESLPITASLVVSAPDFVRSGGLDIRFTLSYEDYSFDWRLVLAGVLIFCTSLWQVLHKHRQGFWPITKEYRRSGGGAGMLAYLYPNCTFGTKRFRQVRIVSIASIVLPSILGGLILFHAWTFLAGFIGFSLFVYTLLGIMNILKARMYLRAVFFPMMSAWGILVFTYGFLHQLYTKGGGGKILQTIWSL